jgi:hypothetical protein
VFGGKIGTLVRKRGDILDVTVSVIVRRRECLIVNGCEEKRRVSDCEWLWREEERVSDCEWLWREEESV